MFFKSSLVLAAFLAGPTLAAPPADQKMVEAWSRMDEMRAARGVQKAAAPRELKRAEQDLGLQAFLDENQNTGLLVLKGDTILAEHYQYGRNEGHRFGSASVAKTVLGMLVGFALQDRSIKSLDDKASDYVSELKDHPYGDTTVRDLLTMSSGMELKEDRIIRNTVRQATQGGAETIREWTKRDYPAGTRFRYNSADSQVLGLVLIHATKTPLATYLSEKIWQPMGAEANATWLVDKGGFEMGYCCLNARLRDYARFGMLLANEGRAGPAPDSPQVIPAEWVRAATSIHARHLAVGRATPRNGYGFQTWLLGEPTRTLPDHTRHPLEGGNPVQVSRFAALGLHGQALFIDPASKLVVVHTAVWDDGNDRAARGRQFRLWESLLRDSARIGT